ncbi:MAG: putative polyadenylate-binding protein [Streblomastix strix]|uniref:Putative polyadenylate-binding protein n=1 Tax=Streblomastix strix TaxID=222440 RepID=A0A5J4V0Q2_9EUKA|nr:MAG: putative polyadenylate-binding protein [Streblomastix strix]
MKCIKQSTQLKNIYIEGFPIGFSDEQLFNLFKKYGKILSCTITRNNEGISKGFGFCCYEQEASANVAITEMKGKMIGERNLIVDYAVNKVTKQQSKCIRLKTTPPLLDILQITNQYQQSQKFPTKFNLQFLSKLSPDQQKQYIGEFLYMKISAIDGHNAEKITGMILELDISVLLVMLMDDSLLKQRILDAQRLISTDGKGK